jgi:alkanesulfonate monooxygenase SsuD/methylene tetrahydromethanopterin reductase-like flavin-dependent oxidoreductase (luciferase family)
VTGVWNSGVGRGGVLEAYFWGSDADVERNYVKYQETLDILRQGLSHEELTYQGEFYTFDTLPMRLRPRQQPYPPLWYMRNAEIAAQEGMHAILVGSLDSFEANVKRYHELWAQHQGAGALTVQGAAPKIGLVNHIVLADTDKEAVAAARPAWDEYVWNLMTPRRVEAERRGLTQFLGANRFTRPPVHSSPDVSARRKNSGAGPPLVASEAMGRAPGSVLSPGRQTPYACTWTNMSPPGQITSSVPSNGAASAMPRPCVPLSSLPQR